MIFLYKICYLFIDVLYKRDKKKKKGRKRKYKLLCSLRSYFALTSL